MASKRTWSIFFSMCLWASAASSAPAYVIITGDPNLGKPKTQVCAACHGEDGNTPKELAINPKLAGQHEKYLIKQMVDFRKGEQGPRANGVMFGFVQALTDQDIKDIAAYYASQTAVLGSVPEHYLALGQQLYRGGNSKTGVPACAACHGANGLGNALMSAPVLSGQNPDYTMAQMKAFKEGVRKNGPNGMMKDIAQKMTDEEIEAVSYYVSGLH